MLSRIFALALPILAFTAPAMAECHFKTANAILCTNGKAAAAAYQSFGFDVDRTNLSYNRQLMQEAGCGRPYGATYKTVEIEEINHGKVATPSGWVEVLIVSVNHHDAGATAKDYIEGTCEKFAPTVSTYMSDPN